MSKELQLQLQPAKTGLSLYAIVWRGSDGKVWNGSSWETYQTIRRGAYDIPMTELGTASSMYHCDFPATIEACDPGLPYVITVHEKEGANPAESDPVLGTGSIEWKMTEATDSILDVLANTQDVLTFGAVEGDWSATTFGTDLLEGTANHYKGCAVVFRDGVLKGQGREITAYSGIAKTLTVDPAFTDTPGDGDSFVILGVIK